MAYASVSDLQARYGEDELVQLTDRGRPPTRTLNAAVAEAALTDAASEADTYLAARYSTPIAAAPAALVQHVCALAWAALHRDRVPEEVAKAADRARAWLRDVAAGRAALMGADGPAADGDAVFVAGEAPVFDATGMRGF